MLRRLLGRPLSLGDQGERAAAKYLRKQRYRILLRQARNRIGELDLVAVDPGDQRAIVFVEVKTRSADVPGHPVEMITPAKQRKLTRVALTWLKSRNLLEHRARFDVVTVIWPTRGQPVIEHFRNAFEPLGSGQMFS